MHQPIPQWIKNLPKTLDKKRKYKSRKGSTLSQSTVNTTVGSNDVIDTTDSCLYRAAYVSESEQDLQDFLAETESRFDRKIEPSVQEEPNYLLSYSLLNIQLYSKILIDSSHG